MVSPLPQFVCVFALCLMNPRRRKRIGGEGMVRGRFSNGAKLDNPLIRPVGHLLPRFRGRRDGAMTQLSSEPYLIANQTLKVALSN